MKKLMRFKKFESNHLILFENIVNDMHLLRRILCVRCSKYQGFLEVKFIFYPGVNIYSILPSLSFSISLLYSIFTEGNILDLLVIMYQLARSMIWT